MTTDHTNPDEIYLKVARLYTVDDLDDARLAMQICEHRMETTPDDVWARIFWSYGAVHHDLSDEAQKRALNLLKEVINPNRAAAAALILTAEIELTTQLQNGESPSWSRQLRLLERSACLMPGWPAIHLRLAYPMKECGRTKEAQREASTALRLLTQSTSKRDPVDRLVAGFDLSPTFVRQEALRLGVDLDS